MEDVATLLGIGFLLGFKHALEPDHVIAVSTMVGKHKSTLKSSFLGLFWGIGHTLTLLVVFLLLSVMDTRIPGSWEMTFEIIVGLMLIYLGFSSFSASKSYKVRKDKGSENHLILKSMFIGQIHGLAGSAAMTLLLVSMVTTFSDSLVYIGLFGIGTILGMLVFTVILSIPYRISSGKYKMNHFLHTAASVISITYGVWYIYAIAG
ncbi:urease accessory protein UreH [Bacillus sp. Marseille-Q3570]|uniref:urease accessory protein UreH n=1 Tax=Bacillus sp. Marseille-Q3570 TaxID=2963522 RepID=UPI0021B7350F|nr:urease accessory protein UreH [Bacillus sp. Marseille-Q3570]